MTEPKESLWWWHKLTRFPFTLTMLTALIVFGLMSNSPAEPIPQTHRHAFGSSLQTLLDGDVFRLFTSLFQTAGGWRFFASVLMLGFCVDWAEWTRGSCRTITVFFSVHLLTRAIIYFACILPLSSIGFDFADKLFDARDVGPSAGYYGCFGFAIVCLSRRLRWQIVLLISIVLIARLAFSLIAHLANPHLIIGNVAHLIAFPLGFFIAGLLKTNSQSPTL